MIRWLTATLLLAVAMVAAPAATGAKKLVNCDRGASLVKAVHQAQPGAVFRIRRICTERVVVQTDGLRLVGAPSAILRAPTEANAAPDFNPIVRVNNATGVELKNLTIQGSPAEGILVEGQADVRLVSVNVADNASVGLLIDHARVTVRDSQFTGNLAGIDATNGGAILAEGQVTGNSNLVVSGGLDVSDNFGPGILADGAGTLALASLDGSPAAPANQVTSNAPQQSVVLSFGSRATIDATTDSVVCLTQAMARDAAGTNLCASPPVSQL